MHFYVITRKKLGFYGESRLKKKKVGKHCDNRWRAEKRRLSASESRNAIKWSIGTRFSYIRGTRILEEGKKRRQPVAGRVDRRRARVCTGCTTENEEEEEEEEEDE